MSATPAATPTPPDEHPALNLPWRFTDEHGIVDAKGFFISSDYLLQHIVTVVNAHAPLVEACRALLPMLVADVERHRISALTYATSHPDTARAAAEARDARAAALEALRAALQKAGAAE